jgi:hypothetical protein
LKEVLRLSIQKIIELVFRLYNLPVQKITVHNGVAVRVGRLLSRDVYPEHEAELIAAMRDFLNCGQQVVLIGGGRGASTVVARHCVSRTGSVTTYEGSIERIGNIQDTLILNCVTDNVSLVHGIVGEAIQLSGIPGEAATIAPSDLPVCDTLVLDCEGAELTILKNMTIRPDVVIVETHPEYDAPAKKVIQLLENIDYTIAKQYDIRRVNLIILAATKNTR